MIWWAWLLQWLGPVPYDDPEATGVSGVRADDSDDADALPDMAEDQPDVSVGDDAA